jgi:hypothetical protein
MEWVIRQWLSINYANTLFQVKFVYVASLDDQVVPVGQRLQPRSLRLSIRD